MQPPALVIRGIAPGPGIETDCSDPRKKNWIVLRDPVALTEKVLFDSAIAGQCSFTTAALSRDSRTLYWVGPSGLAVVTLATGVITVVSGVSSVYIIETGPRRGDLIYERKIGDTYPLFHARPDGTPIRRISDEYFAPDDSSDQPLLQAYLRKLHATITVQGKPYPELRK